MELLSLKQRQLNKEPLNQGGNMKKIIAGLLFLIITITIGCHAIIEPTTPEPVIHKTPQEQDQPTTRPAQESKLVKSDLARETNPQSSPENLQTLAQNTSEFATAFYQKIRDKEGNIIFSPFSIALALSMTLAGAESSTEEAMMNALQYSLPEDQVHPAFNGLLLAIEASEKEKPGESDGSEFQLNIANSIWGHSGYSFKSDFLDILARQYGAGMYNVDYQADPESARELINQWIEDETEDKIKDLIPPGAINQLTRLVLANAIYFNGSWRYPFDQDATEPAPFNLLDGTTTTVDMMKLEGERLAYTSGDAYQAVQLPYLSPDFVMTIFVPDQGAYEDFESGLSAEVIKNITAELLGQPVNLQMPSFDFATSTVAKDPLSALNMAEAFMPDSADFSGITDVEDLYISDVLHKATITVDEEGTEAAAATVVIMRAESAPVEEEPISLVIDRPFLFLIQHQPTGTILFMGRVLQP
jgi:serpin B